MANRPRQGRDALGHFCFCLHLAILMFITLGWMLPGYGLSIFYLVFVPATVLHWQLNGGACALNNLENWLRYRSWRAPERNPEEGAWLRTLLRNLTGIALSRKSMDVFIYAAMAVLWALGWFHFLEFQGT